MAWEQLKGWKLRMMGRNHCQMMHAEELDAEKTIICWQLFVSWLDKNQYM